MERARDAPFEQHPDGSHRIGGEFQQLGIVNVPVFVGIPLVLASKRITPLMLLRARRKRTNEQQSNG